ncbi:MAG: Fe-S oxidoreductase [Treponema sp. GWB1_62_6]|nr:MAG: Fe-S oxidoreductase [Treponema sp. GWA1_62_8]OHE65073.1 MAG: Fe-S oxidoreductase [Treponema sp. GWC1_61_84]OHE65185.1 MAG: Fe-S oxidoreductase [Treponema sp. GWB1_62_6]HCM26059.1 zinc/iron-chelating domain-containing protein [Treponema sp.]
MKEKFYSEGLRFSCERCSACCRHDPGFVFLSRRDAELLAQHRQMSYIDFVATYCRWIPVGDGIDRLSLKELSNYDCVFWKTGGCTVYSSRPQQCRTFPFWNSVVSCAESWEATALDCPGMEKGELHGADEIEGLLALRVNDPVETRRVR